MTIPTYYYPVTIKSDKKVTGICIATNESLSFRADDGSVLQEWQWLSIEMLSEAASNSTSPTDALLEVTFIQATVGAKTPSPPCSQKSVLLQLENQVSLKAAKQDMEGRMMDAKKAFSNLPASIHISIPDGSPDSGTRCYDRCDTTKKAFLLALEALLLMFAGASITTVIFKTAVMEPDDGGNGTLIVELESTYPGDSDAPAGNSPSGWPSVTVGPTTGVPGPSEEPIRCTF
jgi:hypothetical protein